MKKEANQEIITCLNSLMDKICKHIAKEEYDEANKLQDEYNKLEQEYDLFDRTFEENGKTGIKDITCKILVPAIYTEYPELYSYTIRRGAPIAAQNEDGKLALVTSDGEGTPLTEFKYDMILTHHHTNFYTCFRKTEGKNKMGLLNIKGEEILSCDMDNIFEALNGITVFEKEGKQGLITVWGLYVPAVYDEITEDDEYYVYARLNDKWGYISDEGGFIPESDEDTLFDTPLLNFNEI